MHCTCIISNYQVPLSLNAPIMYFPTSAARRISTVPGLPNLSPEPILTVCPSPRKAFFLTLTRNGLTIWRVRVRIFSFHVSRCSSFHKPCAVLAHFSRTPTSRVEHGDNVCAYWSPDSLRVVIGVSIFRSSCRNHRLTRLHRLLNHSWFLFL